MVLTLSLRFSSVFHSACVVCLGFPFCSCPSSAICPGHAFCFLELPHPHPMSFLMHLLFCPVGLTLFQPLFPLLHPPTLSCCKREKKGGEGIETQKKAQTKTNLECVTKCCVLLVASVCPCGLQPARPPHPSAVCPARLPALPLLPTTRSSVPGCLVMVPDV